MATLLLAVGANALSSGLGLTAAAAAGSFTAALGQAAIGAVASIAGGWLDNLIFGGFQDPVEKEGPRLQELRYTGSTEGAPIPDVFGNYRVSGQLIWATRFKEVITKETEKVGGKGGGGQKATTTTYNYYVSLAVGIARGPISSIRRVWADGQSIDQKKNNVKIYWGDDDQTVDSTIETVQGVGNVPAYKGVCYMVIEDFKLNDFGNRIPNFNFEVVNTLPTDRSQSVEGTVQAVTIIPASTEHGYDPLVVEDVSDPVTKGVVNVQNEIGDTDWNESMAELARVCPNVKSVVLVVAWMGTDLRMGQCKIVPRMEYTGETGFVDVYDEFGAVVGTKPVGYRATNPIWQVNGVKRTDAIVDPDTGDTPYPDGMGGSLLNMTTYTDPNGNEYPAYGSAPSDGSVFRAIQDLKARGYEVVFYPFIMMDIAEDNTLPDPYNPGSYQPNYPWRGRITCDPAPGVAGSPDKTAAVNAQVNAFFGTATPSDFIRSGVTTIFTGSSSEWSFRRMCLHYAHLCDMAGGVDRFIIGTEMRGLTQVRSSTSVYPAVDKLVALAADVRSIVGAGTQIGYAAVWSEYHGHNPADGTGDFHFHLDPLWSSSDIDFIGIDNYQPMSDWREGSTHLDRLAGWTSIYDEDYLKSNIEGGEYYDWYYPSAGASGNEASPERIAQTRLGVTDGAYGKPWVFRLKDIRNWWNNSHYNRVAGVEVASPTAWVPKSKPIVFTEAGAAAVDKSTNQPNVFLDPKSFESFRPYFSLGRRDDYLQRQYIRVIYDYWNPANGNNEWSSSYLGWMIEWDRTHIWTWDARPYPAFPKRKDYWPDAKNWAENHWITGRMGFVDLKDLVKEICIRSGADPARIDTTDLEGTVQGFIIDRRMSARAALTQLMSLYRFSAVETGNDGGTIKFIHRNQEPVVTILAEDLIRGMSEDGSELYNLQRAQETDLPRVLSLNYIDVIADYRQSVVEAKNRSTPSTREETVNFAVGFNTAQAQGIVESLLSEIWSGREKLGMVLPPRYWYLEPGDVINFPIADQNAAFRITEITKEYQIQVTLVRMDESAFTVIPGTDRDPIKQSVPIFIPIKAYFLELPMLTGAENPAAPYVAASADPWSGAFVFSSPTTQNYQLNTTLDARTVMGVTTTALPASQADFFDRENTLEVELYFGNLSSTSDGEVLNGANVAAVETSPGVWEVIQFAEAEASPNGSNRWYIRKLLRGRGGTEHAIVPVLNAGASFTMLEPGVTLQMNFGQTDIGIAKNLKYGPQADAIDASTYKTTSFTTVGEGYRPRSPVDVKAVRNWSNDNLTVSWKRRTRYGGGWYDLADIPLNEQAESYTLKLFNGAVLERTVTVDNAQSFVYTAAMQTADGFDIDTDTLNITVEQISAIVGPGYPGAGTWEQA